MIPIITANYYGPVSFASINGILAPIMIVFGAMVPVGAGYVADHMASYDVVFMSLLVVVGAAIMFTYLLRPPVKEKPI